MCGTCGCGKTEHSHDHGQAHGHEHNHEHSHDHSHDHQETRRIEVEQALLAENDRFAAENRGFFNGRRIRCVNLISSPGSGKTTLLEKTLVALHTHDVRCAVIEGDQATDLDAQRIARTNVPVTQIETGRSCHLDAHQIQHALGKIALPETGLLFIENVGNLICPTEFDLGERERVVILSVTEGDDKPAKYPLAFKTASAVVLTKTDLLPYVDFDIARAKKWIAGLNPSAPIFELSAKTGDGMEPWLTWLKRKP